MAKIQKQAEGREITETKWLNLTVFHLRLDYKVFQFLDNFLSNLVSKSDEFVVENINLKNEMTFFWNTRSIAHIQNSF